MLIEYTELIPDPETFDLMEMEINLKKAFEKEFVEIEPRRLQGMIDTLNAQQEQITSLKKDVNINQKMPLSTQLTCSAKLEGYLTKWHRCKNENCELCNTFKKQTEQYEGDL